MQLSIVLQSCLVALSVALPAERRATNKTFTVSQVEAGVAVKIAPAVSLLDTYKKYSSVGAQAPLAVKAAAAAAVQSGTVSAASVGYDVEYVCPVSIGGQTLNLDFDTGSSDLWVFSTLMPSSQTSGHDVYNTSSGTLMTGQSWQILYGDGSSGGGSVYSDKVTVGSVTATSQAVEAATSVSSTFLTNSASDGLLGLAFSSLNTVRPNQQTTFFDTVKSSLASPLFTVDLKKGMPGTYDFGFIDSSKYVGSITYVDVIQSNGFWEFAADGYVVGNSSIVETSYTSIVDTGTSLMVLPPAVVTAYYNQLNGSEYDSNFGAYIYPCDVTPPDFTAVIGGSAFTIPGPYINYVQISSTMCYGGIQSNNGMGFSIFGDIFLKSQFVVFTSGTTPQLGFAAQSSLDDVDEEYLEWYLECDGTAVS